ncbi:MAG TPA: hypothetical protein VK588_16205 [Chitinophagaceae bacterium]|nr:hypothetical protein [Chitinophagaceae bacterium]
MKSKCFLTCFLIFPVFVSIFISCKKNDVVKKKSTCRIVTLTDLNGSTSTIYNISYNNDGKISTLNSGVSSSVFTYSGNTVLINKTNSGSFSERDSITVNSNGKPLNLRQYYDQAGTNWSNIVFEYDGSGVMLKSEETNNSSSTLQTTLYSFTSGNLVGIQSTSDNLTLEYFSDKTAQQGDYLGIVSLINYGVNLYPHTNLVKSLNSGSNLTNFDYEMNTDGLISKLTATSGSTVETITYQYNCN